MNEWTALRMHRGRLLHRVVGHEPPSSGRMGAPKVACGKALPFWTDRFGYEVLYEWDAFIVTEQPVRPCRACWPAHLADQSDEEVGS